MSNSVSAFMTRRIVTLAAFCFILSTSIQAQDLPIADGEKYILGDITVTGNVSYNEQTVIAYTGLKKGEEIYIPGDKISKVLKKLWGLDLFSDINFYITSVEDGVANLELEITEVPQLAEVRVRFKKAGTGRTY